MKNPAEMTTEELEQIIRDDSNSENTLPWEEMEPILVELDRRYRESNPDAPQTPPPFPGRKTLVDGNWSEFLRRHIKQ